MKIPAFFEHATCELCGKACVPMTNGDRFRDTETGEIYDLSVCFDCDSQLGDLAYVEACVKRRSK